MSAPGRTNDIYLELMTKYPGRVETICWNEDLDLNAAPGALKALVGSHYKGLYDGTDDIRTREGYGTPQLLALLGSDESGGGAGGYLTVEGRARRLAFGKMSNVAAGEYWEYRFSRPVLLPEGGKISCIGNQSGAGAEQHTVIAFIHYPKLPKVPLIKNAIGMIGPLGWKVGTRVAETLGPHSVSPFGSPEDSEEAISQDDGAEYAIDSVINGPGLADTGVFAMLFPDKEGIPGMEIYIPASMAGSEENFLLPPYRFTSNAPVKLAACGKATTSDEYTLHLLTSLPYGDMDANKQGVGGGSSGGSSGSGSGSIISPISGQLGQIYINPNLRFNQLR